MVTNFGREGKPTLKQCVSLTSFLCLDTYNMDAIAINKPYKLNFTVFYNLLSYAFVAGL